LKIIDPKRTQDEQRRNLHHLRWGVCLLCLIATSAPFTLSPITLAVVKEATIHADMNLDVAPGCLNLIEGGDFEQFNPSWQFSPSTRPPLYTNEQTFNNSTQSLRIGNGLDLPNIASVSEVRYKPIVLPTNANTLILRFRYYLIHEGAADGDWQHVALYNETADQPLTLQLSALGNTGEWKIDDDPDLIAYAGQTVSLRFRVQNDGSGGRTLMYVDNVELEYCAATPIPTLSPTLSPTPTGTPLPTSIQSPTPTALVVTTVPTPPLPPEDPTCPNLLVNGSFESFDGWYFGENPVPARYVSTFFQEGMRSVLLGNPPENPNNVITFSSIRQLVTIPFTTGPVQLRWWRLLYTTQSGLPTATTDRQDLILLSPGLQPIQILRRDLRNENNWQEDAVDLSAYRGQTLYLYFNVFNDANNVRTWMYLDNVRLRVCGAPVVPPPPAMPSAIATPIAIPVTPNLTYTIIPTLTLSPFSTWIGATQVETAVTETATLTPLPFLPSKETVAAALAPPVPATPTSTTLPLPTLHAQTVLTSATTSLTAPPISTPAPSTNQEASSMDRLGALGFLIGILVVIGIVAMVILRMFQRSP